MSTAFWQFRQWLRRLGDDHDELIAPQHRIDATEPMSLTQTEISEGMKL